MNNDFFKGIFRTQFFSDSQKEKTEMDKKEKEVAGSPSSPAHEVSSIPVEGKDDCVSPELPDLPENFPEDPMESNILNSSSANAD